MFKWDKIRIFEIRREAHRYLFKEINGDNISNRKVVYFYYYVLPIIVSIGLCYCKIRIDKDSSTYLITGISIFAGLFFNLLLVVADKMAKRKKMLSSKKEQIQHYAKLYKNFSEQLIGYISYAIILSLALIILMFLTQAKLSDVFIYNVNLEEVYQYAINSIVFILGFQFIIILLVILSNMYIMLLDDVNLDE